MYHHHLTNAFLKKKNNIMAIIKQIKTSSSLSQVGRIRGAKTFPLRNQSLTRESLKDQFRFPSDRNTRWRLPFHERLDPSTLNFPPHAGRVAATPRSSFLGCDRMATLAEAVAANNLCKVTEALPTTIPATTGHHFRRDNDHKNQLNLLYTTV